MATMRGLSSCARRLASQQCRSTRRVCAAAAAAPPSPPPVSLTASSAALPSGTDVLVVGVLAAELGGESLSALDASCAGGVSALIAEADWKAAAGSTLGGRVARDGAATRLLLYGLGEPPQGVVAPRVWQALGAAGGATARTHRASSLALGALGGPLSAAAAQAAATGALLSSFEDTRFKSKPSPATVSRVDVACGASPEDCAAALRAATATAEGVRHARRLVNAPPNVCTPTHLAEHAMSLASQHSSVLACSILEAAECKAKGMGAFLAVSEASDEPPKFIHLTYTPPGGAAPGAPVLALVGKGLTFDSGGYNVKAGPGSMIELMKFDMGGAAAVLGAAHVVAALSPPGCVVHFIIASCENMIGSRGLRPGDILTSYSGKTIEVNNTDAEGRLTLADALTFAQRDAGATRVIDVATLTGACMAALGTSIGGLFSPTDAAAGDVLAAGAAAGERFWRMPLDEAAEYWEQMSSPLADMKNTGMGKGGAITAALFLQKYIEPTTTSWAHLDIAGPVWHDKEGATGFAAATLAKWVMSQGEAAVTSSHTK